MNSKMKYIAPNTNTVNVNTDDVMQGFIVTSYSISEGEAKKGIVMDEENDDDVSSFEGKAIAGWKTWEEQ
jgi:hypothetical protein